LETLKVSKYFFYVGLISAVVAVGYVAPVVLGPLVNPNGHNIINNGPGSILTDYTTWPSLWMFVGFSMFILAAVVGSFAWSSVYYLSSALFGKQQRSSAISILQIIIYVVGVYLSTALMVYVGYTEGLSIAQGASPLVVAGSAQWTVIPTGLGVALTGLGVLLGVLNLFLPSRQSAGS
jgi:hypothetical protein